MRLLQEGACKLEELSSYSEEELRRLLRQCGIPFAAEDSKVGLRQCWGQGPGARLVGGVAGQGYEPP